MQQRLLTIYYGIDRLPYKDENREVHYPIVSSQSGGTLITGENNTSKLVFYVGRIGGGAKQWIANLKKPDGTLSYRLLTGGQSVLLSNGQSDYRVELDISDIFADQIGDVFIGLQGYSGETVIVENDGNYEISGNPDVLATGTIKIKVNYAPNVLAKGETITPTTEQQIMAALGGKIDTSSSIFVVNGLEGFDFSGFANYQTFFDIETGQFYRKTGETLTLVELELEDMLIDGTKLTTYLGQYITTTQASQSFVAKVNSASIVYGRNALNQETTYGVDPDNSYGTSSVAKRYNGQIKAPTPVANGDLANKGYVDNSIQSAIEDMEERSDVTDIVGAYQDLEDYDTSTLALNDIIKVLQDSTHSNAMSYYRWLGSEDGWEYIGSEGPYYTQSETDTLLSAKVDKTTSASKLYGTDSVGAQATIPVEDNIGDVARRDDDGQLVVPLTPTANGHASSKKYIDDGLALKEDVANKVTSLSSSSTDTQYPSAKCVYDITQQLEEIADGKTKSYVISYGTVAPETDAEAQELHKQDGTAFTDLADFTTYVSGCTLNNSVFNSNDSYITLNTNLPDIIYYYIFNDGLVLKIGAGITIPFKEGDVFYVTETSVPDRWYGGLQSWRMIAHKLETALSNYYTKNESIVPSADNTYDIGSSSLKIKDIYLAGKVDFGTKVTGSIHHSYITTDNYDGIGFFVNGIRSLVIYDNALYFAKPLLPNTTNATDLGSSSNTWKNLYLSGVISNGADSYTIEDSYSILFGKYVADNTITTLPYETISQISLSSDTTFSLKSAPTGCCPIYDAIITNVGSSAINITLTSVAKIICNDASITISNNVATLPAGMVVELNIQNGCALIINFDL